MKWLSRMGIALVVFLAVIAILFFSWQNRQTWFGYDVYRVESVSMLPTLKPNNIVIVNLRAFRNTQPKKADIVVLHNPLAVEQKLIKRVFAVPGASVSVVQKNTTLDAQTRVPVTNRKKILHESIDGYFVMGDNPNHSTDSRSFGEVNAELIAGKVVHVF